MDGTYSLSIKPNKITISASGNEGVFYGLVSLLQLVRAQPGGASISLPSVEIIDAPRYQWRGFMLDESRHFFGKEKLITKASKGSNTAANVKWMVRVSMDCKKSSNVIF